MVELVFDLINTDLDEITLYGEIGCENVGFCCVLINFQDGVLIDRLFVNKDHRRKGYGKQLMIQMESILREMNVKKIYLTAIPDEDSLSIADLQKFYRSLGYSHATFNEMYKLL